MRRKIGPKIQRVGNTGNNSIHIAYPICLDHIFNRPGDPLVKICSRRHHAIMVGNGAFSHKIDYITFFGGNSKSQRTPKLHNWFKSNGDFAGWDDFSYWTKW